jgi:hypothetical protein
MTLIWAVIIFHGLSIIALCVGLWVLGGAVSQLQKLELERKAKEIEGFINEV